MGGYVDVEDASFSVAGSPSLGPGPQPDTLLLSALNDPGPQMGRIPGALQEMPPALSALLCPFPRTQRWAGLLLPECPS